jgi:hypothetical protein
MTYPDDLPVYDDDAGLDPSSISDADAAAANEADLIEQAIAVPLPDEDGFDR